MGCFSRSDEERPVLNAPQEEFRHGRNAEDFQSHKPLKLILKYLCVTMCLYKPSGWSLILSIFPALICISQLVYDLFVVCEGRKYINESLALGGPHWKTSNTVYTLASFGGLFSYTLLLISLLQMYRRRRQDKRQAIGPSDALFDDLSNTQVKYIFLSQITLTSLFVSTVVMFYYYPKRTQPNSWSHYLMITGVAAQFLSHWAAIVGCHAFAIPSLALGTLANDTVRRIKEIGKEKTQRRSTFGYGATNKENNRGYSSDNEPSTSAGPQSQEDVAVDKVQKLGTELKKAENDFDIAFEYHEELCAIVSDTVSAYCPWFVMHWLCYGATCLVEVIYISEEFSTHSIDALKLAYNSVFFVTHLYLFLLPCICAACITDTCGGISARVSKTTSKYWHEDHPFRDRVKLTMFTAYAKDRQCVFRIGRLTFTSTLAWISLLLGLTGLLFHFFQE